MSEAQGPVEEKEVDLERPSTNEDVQESTKQEEVKQDDFKEKYYYLAAEMDNLRKRTERERENLIKYGNERILSSMIEVLDNFERTLEALKTETDEKLKNVYVGINMVKVQFWDILAQNGLKAVEAIGKKFDPNFHEALGQEVREDKEDQEILKEYQKGYTLNGRLLRAAKVVITKKE